MSAWSHWPPRKGERVINNGQLGKIILVSWPDEEVTVRYPKRTVTHVYQEFEFNGHTCTSVHYMIGGVWYPSIIALFAPDMLRPVIARVDSYTFDDLRGNWSSSDGGEEAWKL